VGDNAMETRRQQSEGRFADSKEQERINRESRTAAFEAGSRAGQSAYEQASAGVTQAMQIIMQAAVSDETRAAAAKLATDKQVFDLSIAKMEAVVRSGATDAQSRRNAIDLYNIVVTQADKLQGHLNDLITNPIGDKATMTAQIAVLQEDIANKRSAAEQMGASMGVPVSRLLTADDIVGLGNTP